MIGSLSGEVRDLEFVGDHAMETLIEVQGVGYRVLLGSRTAAGLPPIGEGVRLSIHTHVREGEITLYGFLSREERRAFELLIAAHGVGPALGLAILSVHTPAALARAVADGDLDALCLVPGVGRKTAQRLAVELASRFDVMASASVVGAAHSVEGRERVEVREALVALGYGTEEVRVALESLDGSDSVEELLRQALRELAPQR